MRKLIQPTLVLASISLLQLSAVGRVAHAETPEEKGLAIAVEADERDLGWGDSQSEMLMILRNKKGQETEREIRNKTLEVEGDGDKSLTVFDRPKDVQGTAFLSFTHATAPDDQWLYLPALKRVKRISSANKSGPFMGSEFAFEDIASQEVEKYTYKHIKDDQINGLDVFVVERYPAYEKSGYTKQIAWLDKEHYRPQQVEFYDRKDKLLKTLVYVGYQQYLDKYWRADEMQMENHQTGKSTRLVFSNYKFGVGLSDRDFDKNSLKRAK